MHAPENPFGQGDSRRLVELAPKPTTMLDTGLERTFLGDLLSKHLLAAGVLSTSQLIERLCLAGAVVEAVLQFLRAEGRIEVRARSGFDADLRYGLTERGRNEAQDAFQRSGYVGPAPVPLAKYSELVRKQCQGGRRITAHAMREAFSDTIVADRLLDLFGPAINSGRAIFLYGEPGTGKTFLAHRLARTLAGVVLVPHAVSIDETVVQVFDPVVHRRRGATEPRGLYFDEGYDGRYVACNRPVVVAGGELAADMLEVRFDAALREYVAPLQLKANGGLFLIDDLGRQRITPAALFNRWIVPMEEGRDFLSLNSGRHFSVPFDVVLVFSTNFEPQVLADDAFLRRIAYKIELRRATPDEYERIWELVCRQKALGYDPAVVGHALQLHRTRGVPLLPCHPRDLIGMALDHAAYFDQKRAVTTEGVDAAWDAYFVRADNRAPAIDGQSFGDESWSGNVGLC